MVLSSSVSFDTLLWVVLSSFFVESKSFEFSVEEGGTFYLLRINERGKDSLRSVFIGKEIVIYDGGLYFHWVSWTLCANRQRWDAIFILQLGSNEHGSFLMISELLHGRQKGFIVVPEGKLGSGWRGFGFHLRKAIARRLLPLNCPQRIQDWT